MQASYKEVQGAAYTIISNPLNSGNSSSSKSLYIYIVARALPIPVL